MDKHYPDNHFSAMQIFRRVTSNKKTQIQLRQRQLASHGYKRLLQQLIEHSTREALLQNLFLIRLPDDASSKLEQGHAVKKVARSGCASKMLSSAVFAAAYKKWIQHVQRTNKDESPPYLYFWAYPPDLSFVFLTYVPFEETEKFDESLPPVSEFVPHPEL